MILLVDDDEDLLLAVAELLRGRAFAVMTARSAWEAGALLEAGKVELLVSDFDLGPGADGAALLAHAARHRPQVLRILFCGSSPPPRVRAHAVVAKPDVETLLRVIVGMLPPRG